MRAKSPSRLLIQCGQSSFCERRVGWEIHHGIERAQRGLAAVSMVLRWESGADGPLRRGRVKKQTAGLMESAFRGVKDVRLSQLDFFYLL